MTFLEGSAPALPKNSAHQEMRPSEFSPNEFGAHKIRHQPLAKASAMDRKILKGYTFHSALRTFMHSCTHACLHACTPTRLHAGSQLVTQPKTNHAADFSP
jgi:hypothetical protein